MDILTPKGKVSVDDEQEARRIWESNFHDYLYIETPKNKPAAFDAVLVKDGTICAIVETKCRRDMDIDKFKTDYRSKWLISYHKVRDCCVASDLIGVPFVGFLYIQPSNVLLVQEIYKEKQFKRQITIEKTKTQATTNGGTAYRDNAFIDMANAKILKGQ